MALLFVKIRSYNFTDYLTYTLIDDKKFDYFFD